MNIFLERVAWLKLYKLHKQKNTLSNFNISIIHLPSSEKIVSTTSPLNLFNKIATPADCDDAWLKKHWSPHCDFQIFTSLLTE